MREIKKVSINSLDELKPRILLWAQQFEEVAWMDSNSFKDGHSKYSAILAVDAFTAIKTDSFNAFEKLEEYQTTTKDWLFGYLTYDLKNDVENLSSSNVDGLAFPDLQFFQPKKIFFFSETEVEIHYLNMVDDELENDWLTILSTDLSETSNTNNSVKISLRTSKDAYFEKVGAMLKHIERGDIYEANFCQEFYTEDTVIDPLSTFLHLNEISLSPFATFLKFTGLYALSASPERYLKKTGDVVVSQPIKGTAKRLSNASEDKKMIEELQSDPKERSENIMITDLVRNDLSRIAKKGTVTVEELCKIYTFEQVHQMISTIRCEVKDSVSPVEIIKNSFPMGSMTGAPKVSAMKIIEQLEDAKRGLYSGAVGYFTPSGDFDFNVVIRSILYNEEKKYVSFSVGGAITTKSIIENEYQECLLKAKAMRTVLES
ncbi:anthranilate synthase component I family protein [Marixanthomonas ophiurae]|uniref:Anthranilate synthase component I family protein n=1 Tax=Marixanthomonas ophiurae TaxID=387659 RepID=A0A3E1Q7A1_9FLAO|nr:anthranilate synthase component I family protein [Marixanthomonas ophiurae]RFN58003.1 anthranilate synthase component I family protein [Marixanthomonas ophiurae]